MTINDHLAHARALGLWGIVAAWDSVKEAPWLPQLLQREEDERSRRSLERRFKRARLGRFTPLTAFDWGWPRAIRRHAVESLLSLEFIRTATNVLLLGGHGTGKTMIAKNLAHHAIQCGHSALLITANALLNDLADKGTGATFSRRLKYYSRPDVLVIDEVGYLTTTAQHADLLFHVVNERYQMKPIILTSNRAVTDWQDVFPGASSVVGIVDRLIHQAEILTIDADSYRLREANLRENSKRKEQKRK
jgi:DNA replication protein DnaC